jgi:hypothetical protein
MHHRALKICTLLVFASLMACEKAQVSAQRSFKKVVNEVKEKVGAVVEVFDPADISLVSMEPSSGTHWIETPVLKLSVSSDSTVTLYKDDQCLEAVSEATSLNEGEHEITAQLTEIGVIDFHAQATSEGGTVGECVALDKKYNHIRRFFDPNPSSDNYFATQVVMLATGNVVVTSQFADINGVTDAGAVYLFNGKTGALISTLFGSTASDQVGSGGVTALSNGNFVIPSPNWDCQAALGCSGTVSNVGAVTFGSGTSGINGAVTAVNSLVGSTTSDHVGSNGVTALTNGNYLVRSSNWDCLASLGCSGTIGAVGAVTFGSGTTGISGAVSATNSLVGSTANDQVGSNSVTALTNGNYVVSSPIWDCQASLGCSGTIVNVGAVTFGSGTTGVSGAVSATNSLVGSTASDAVGGYGVTALTNGNYVVRSSSWDCLASLGCSGTITDVGAVTFGSGTNGISGAVSSTNSLVGSTALDNVGITNVTALSNGNYVVSSQNWDCQASLGCLGTISNVGAVTFGSGTTGVSGAVSATNSLVGSTASDDVGGGGVVALTNGNYVVRSSSWDCQASLGCSGAIGNVGAVTFGSGTTGISGAVSATNSLVGSTASDTVGSQGVLTLTNGNYVVRSTNWDCLGSLGCSGTIADVGAVTFGSGTTGISGAVSATNSLVGSTISDQVGGFAVTALSNGNYVVSSAYWNCTAALGCSGTIADVGAVTFGSGTTGISGAVSALNSLVGSSPQDYIGSPGVTALTNGNYIVRSNTWDCQLTLGCPAAVANAGAFTFASGSDGAIGVVSTENSLVGSTTSDVQGSITVALANGDYLISSPLWSCKTSLGCGVANEYVGALTLGDGEVGTVGILSDALSLTAFAAVNGKLLTASNVNHYAAISTSHGRLTNRSMGLLIPSSAQISGHMYALQKDLDNDSILDSDDIAPLDVKLNTGIDNDGDGWHSASDRDDASYSLNSGVDNDSDGWDNDTDSDDFDNKLNSGIDADSDGWESGSDTDDGDYSRNSGSDNDGDGWESGTDFDDNNFYVNSGTDSDGDGWESGIDSDDNDYYRNSGTDNDVDGWDDGIDWDDTDSRRRTGNDQDSDGWDDVVDSDDNDYYRNSGTDNDADGWDDGVDADDNDGMVQ